MSILNAMTTSTQMTKALAASISKANTSAASAIAVAKMPITQAAGAGRSSAFARRRHTKPAVNATYTTSAVAASATSGHTAPLSQKSSASGGATASGAARAAGAAL